MIVVRRSYLFDIIDVRIGLMGIKHRARQREKWWSLCVCLLMITFNVPAVTILSEQKNIQNDDNLLFF